MSKRNTLVRTLHDVGLGAWFGGALMGAIGLNGAANDVADPKDRSRVAAAGWARWAPVNAAAIGAHAIGGAGLILANRGRVKHQSGVGANTAVKSVLTVAAAAVTAYSGWQGKKVAEAGQVHAEGGTNPSAKTPAEVATAQRQLRIAQWVTPALTGVLVALGAQQGEQQRGTSVVSGLLHK